MARPQRVALVYDSMPAQYVLTRHPSEAYLVHTSDKVISRSLFVKGQFDFHKFETAYSLLQKYSVLPNIPMLIDAGANVGSICIPAVKRGFVHRCIAIEPDHENFRLLRINSLLNEVENLIDARQVAVGAALGQISVVRSPSNFGDHRVRSEATDLGASVPLITLDQVADGLDLSEVILWLDIQGYEGYALQGARRLLAAGVPFVTEFSKRELDSTGSFEIFLSAISSSGYQAFFDLGNSAPEANLVSLNKLRLLAERLEGGGTFTDLLFLRQAP